MKADEKKGTFPDDESDELLPGELPFVPDELLAELESAGGEVFEEPSLAAGESAEDTEELGKINDPVRTYLHEMGTISLLTRQGEIDLAKRIERGQSRVKKALSRAPLVIQEALKLGEALQQDRVPSEDR